MSALPRVTSILAEAGLSPDYSMVPPDLLKAAQERGTRLHDAVEAHTYKYLVEEAIAPEVRPYFDGYLKFLKDSGYQPTHAEVELIHPSWRYIGHPDNIGWLNGRRRILDLKTPEQVDVRAAAYQLAAYRLVWNTLNPKEPCEMVGVLQVKSDGTYRWHDPEVELRTPLSYFERVFLAALILHQDRKER